MEKGRLKLRLTSVLAEVEVSDQLPRSVFFVKKENLDAYFTESWVGCLNGLGQCKWMNVCEMLALSRVFARCGSERCYQHFGATRCLRLRVKVSRVNSSPFVLSQIGQRQTCAVTCQAGSDGW